MRVVATVQPGAGHLLPVVPLLHAFRDAGHDVLLAGSATLAPLARQYGLALSPVGPAWSWADPGRLLGRQVGDDPAAQRAALAEAVEVARFAVLPDVLALLATSRADLVVHEQYEPGGALAAEVNGTACLCVGHGYSPFLGATADVPRRPAARAALGLRSRSDPAWPYAYADSWPASLHPFPPVEQSRRWPMRPCPPAPVTDLQAADPWSGPGARVLLTFGTAAGSHRDLLAVVASAAAAAGGAVRVLDAGPPSAAGALPALGPLLAQADLAVTHGGAGSTVGAMAAGLPLLVLPVHEEQRYLAFRLVGAGAALSLLPGEVSPAAVQSAVLTLLTDPSYRGNARRLAAEVQAMPGPSLTVDRVEAMLLASPRSRRGVAHAAPR